MRRTSARSGTSTTSVCQSGSATAMRPPGRTTRAISASARAGSARCCSVRSARTTSKLLSAKGSAWASPVWNSIGSPSPRATARLGRERLGDVDAAGAARRTDDLGHGAHVLARSAADIERAHARTQPERGEDPPLVRLHRCQRGHRIQVDDERAGLARAVHVLEADSLRHGATVGGSSPGWPVRKHGDWSPGTSPDTTATICRGYIITTSNGCEGHNRPYKVWVAHLVHRVRGMVALHAFLSQPPSRTGTPGVALLGRGRFALLHSACARRALVLRAADVATLERARCSAPCRRRRRRLEGRPRGAPPASRPIDCGSTNAARAAGGCGGRGVDACWVPNVDRRRRELRRLARTTRSADAVAPSLSDVRVRWRDAAIADLARFVERRAAFDVTDVDIETGCCPAASSTS